MWKNRRRMRGRAVILIFVNKVRLSLRFKQTMLCLLVEEPEAYQQIKLRLLKKSQQIIALLTAQQPHNQLPLSHLSVGSLRMTVGVILAKALVTVKPGQSKKMRLTAELVEKGGTSLDLLFHKSL